MVYSRPMLRAAGSPASWQIYAPFDSDQPPPYCTVYTHLVKSGGTSLKDQLQRQSVKGGMPKPGACENEARLLRDKALLSYASTKKMIARGCW